ncbi:MAG TPA: hypothetical protein VFZ58_00150 [Candidatus Saccharimonadales bacterium]
MQPDTISATPTPPQNTRQKRGKLLLFIGLGIITVIALLVTIWLFVLKPNGVPPAVVRPAVTIAGKPYLYACSMFTHGDITSAFNISDKDKFFVSTTDTYSTNGKPVDILRLTQKDEYGSSCTYNFDVTDLTPEGRSKSKKVDIYAVQYKDDATARKTYEEYKARVTAKPLPSVKPGYAFNEQDEKTGKQFLSASVLRGNLEIIITTSTDFGFSEEEQIAVVDNLAKTAFKRIDDGQAQKTPDFNDSTSLSGKPARDVCANFDIARLGASFNTLEFRPTDINSIQNMTRITDKSYQFASLESVCSYRFRTVAERQDEANAALAYNDRFTHTLNVTKRIFSSAEEASETFEKGKITLRTPSSNDKSRGEYAEVAIADGGAKVVSVAIEDTMYNYYILQGNNYYRIEVISNNLANKTFTPKGIKVTDSFVEKIFEQASR